MVDSQVTSSSGINKTLMAGCCSSANIGNWKISLGSKTIVCDSVMASIYGIDSVEASMGVPFEKLSNSTHIADREYGIEMLAETLPLGGVFVTEYRIVPYPDAVRWVLARGRCEADANGRMRGRGIVVDVTDSKNRGCVEEPAFFMRESDVYTTPLDHVADQLLTAHKMIGTLGSKGSRLRIFMEALLLEVGVLIASDQKAG